MSSWMLGTPNKGIFITVMMICRCKANNFALVSLWLINVTMIFFARNAYVRYAPGLLKDGIQLLHWLMIIFISTAVTHGFFIWHVKAWWRGTYFESTVKFKMCTRDMDESVSRKGLKHDRHTKNVKISKTNLLEHSWLKLPSLTKICYIGLAL